MKQLVIFGFFYLSFFISCTDDGIIRPSITGKAGEVVLVIENSDWESGLGQKFIEIISADHPALPQDEPMFDLVNIPGNAYTSIFKTHRNLIIVDISAKYDEAGMKVEENINASPQTVVTFSGRNRDSVIKLLDEKRQFLTDVLLNAERQRIITNYKKYEVGHIRKKLEQKHNISMNFPKGYTLDLDTTNFIWISYEPPHTSQGIFIYYYDYNDTSLFRPDNLLNMRDSLLKLYVPGPMPGSYMTTEHEHLIPQFSEFMLNGRYVAEIRGLWRVEGDFMGGPFINISMVDEKRNRVVTVEGYVFAPKFDKRNFLRQVEAILYTLEFKDEKTDEGKVTSNR